MPRIEIVGPRRRTRVCASQTCKWICDQGRATGFQLIHGPPIKFVRLWRSGRSRQPGHRGQPCPQRSGVETGGVSAPACARSRPGLGILGAEAGQRRAPRRVADRARNGPTTSRVLPASGMTPVLGTGQLGSPHQPLGGGRVLDRSQFLLRQDGEPAGHGCGVRRCCRPAKIRIDRARVAPAQLSLAWLPEALSTGVGLPE